MFFLFSCVKTHYFRNIYNSANDLLYATENFEEELFLKAHLHDGNVYILRDTWTVDTIDNTVSGTGEFYDFSRSVLNTGDFVIPIHNISVFETNKNLTEVINQRKAVLGILTGVEVIFGLYCITVPKACYGSCPTFYIDPEHNFHYADAEGFSNAILPSMEYGDIDALGNHKIKDKIFSITMKNEALETHCVNSVNILAYPLRAGERVYQSPDAEFFLCKSNYQLSRAITKDDDITQYLKYNDKNEWVIPADEDNMKSKTSVILEFDNTQNLASPGFILHFRQSLMTTFLLYSAYNHMGNRVGDFLAKMNSGQTIQNRFAFFREILGDIEIYIWDYENGDWVIQGSFYETGPIAINKQMIPLDQNQFGKDIRIKMILNEGLWKIDYAALTNIEKEVELEVLDPLEILVNNKPDRFALSKITDTTKHLISLPGNQWEFVFEMPDNHIDYELFLYSKGYYLSWIHRDWTASRDLYKLRQMLKNPRRYLRKQASEYKEYESKMEELFWNSRIDKNVFSNF